MRGEIIGRSYPADLQVSYWMTTVDIDPRFAHAHSVPTCFAFKSETPACDKPLERFGSAEGMPATNVGRYPPLAPLISGLGTVFGVDDKSVVGARLTLAVACSLLITLGVLEIRRRRASGVAVLLALFPGTVFLASTMSPSGLEIAGAIALWCGILGVGRPGHARHFSWAVLLGGLAVIGARPIGFVVYLVILAIAAIAGNNPTSLWRRHSRSLAIHSAAVAGMIFWYLVVYDAQSSRSLVAGFDAMTRLQRITHSLESVPRMIDEAFGNFGWLDTPMPRLALYLLVGLIAIGMSLGLHQADNRTISAVAVGLIVMSGLVVAIELNYYSLFRLFGVQGRHVAPIMVGVILIATSRLGHSVARDRVLGFGWATIMGWSAWGAIRRYSVGIKPDNAFDMFTESRWSPMIGLRPSLLLLLVVPFAVVFVVQSEQGDRQ